MAGIPAIPQIRAWRRGLDPTGSYRPDHTGWMSDGGVFSGSFNDWNLQITHLERKMIFQSIVFFLGSVLIFGGLLMCDAKDPQLNMEKVGWFCFSSGYPGELELGFHKLSCFLGFSSNFRGSVFVCKK